MGHIGGDNVEFSFFWGGESVGASISRLSTTPHQKCDRKGRDWYYLCLTEFYPKWFWFKLPTLPWKCQFRFMLFIKKNWGLETLLLPLSSSINLPYMSQIIIIFEAKSFQDLEFFCRGKRRGTWQFAELDMYNFSCGIQVDSTLNSLCLQGAVLQIL